MIAWPAMSKEMIFFNVGCMFWSAAGAIAKKGKKKKKK